MTTTPEHNAARPRRAPGRRPRNDPRPHPRDAILHAARDLFYRKGIAATSVDDLADAAGVCKMTVYAHFHSKDDVALAYVQAAADEWLAYLSRAAHDAGPDPTRKLLALFDAAADWAERAHWGGCTFQNAVVELRNPDHPATRAAADAKARALSFVRSLAADAHARDPDTLARQVTTLLDGALSSAALLRSRDAFTAAHAAARQLLLPPA